VGSQSRSVPHVIRAMQVLKDGAIGNVYAAKGLCFKRRKSIGKTPPEPVPVGIDWDQFLGPAPMRPFTKNRFAYNWHWFWDTGNGDLGNQGVHQMDICRWGLGVEMPNAVVSTGGKYVYDDDQETPNTQLATYDYGGREIIFEVRGLPSGPEGGVPVKGGNTVGNLFLGSDGWMWLDGGGFQVYKGDSSEKAAGEKAEPGDQSTVLHMKNFLAACRSRKHEQLNADIAIGAASAALCHLANVSYRVGKKLSWEVSSSRFSNDTAANALLTRDYRKPYVV
jgi:Oxidoreductase family, C-terminal alpha/beta domain